MSQFKHDYDEEVKAEEKVILGASRIAELCERVLMAKLVESIRLGRVEL